MGQMADLLDAGNAIVFSQLDEAQIAEPLTFERMSALIAGALSSGTDFRMLWATEAGKIAYGTVAQMCDAPELLEDEKLSPEIAGRALMLSYLAASGAGDFQYLLGGRHGSWVQSPDHKYYKLGLWNATKRALGRYSKITRDPVPEVGPKPAGCLVLLVALASAAAAALA